MVVAVNKIHATDDVYNFTAGQEIGGNVLDNDTAGANGHKYLRFLDGQNVNAKQPDQVTDIAGKFGIFHLKADGSFTYTLNPDVAAGLQEGQTLKESLTYKISDGSGSTDVGKLTINIAGAPHPVGHNVGYYDALYGDGEDYALGAITGSGNTGVDIHALSAAELAGIDTLFVTNPNNGGAGDEWLANFANVSSFVSNGGTLVVFDRQVAGDSPFTPGFSGPLHRDLGADLNFENSTVLGTHGPGGTLDDTSLDGGNWSDHGYVNRADLPAGATVILTTGDSNHVTTFEYSYGGGHVIYSTIPADYYLHGNGGFSVPVTALIENILAGIHHDALS